MTEHWAANLTTPPTGPRQVRFDPEKLYVALDRRRRELGISRRELLRQIGENTPSSITRLGQGRHPSADLLVRFLVWLGSTDVAPFLSPIEPGEPGDPRHTIPAAPAEADGRQRAAGDQP